MILSVRCYRQTVTTSDHQIERFQGKILEAIGPLSRLWKGSEGIDKALPDEAVEVLVDKFVTLVELFCCWVKPLFLYIYPLTNEMPRLRNMRIY